VFSEAKMSKEEGIVSDVGVQETSQTTSKTASVEEEARNCKENKVRNWFQQIYKYLEFTRAYKFVLCMYPHLEIKQGEGLD
jgi:hypothetical protein